MALRKIKKHRLNTKMGGMRALMKKRQNFYKKVLLPCTNLGLDPVSVQFLHRLIINQLVNNDANILTDFII